jgi:hypothetical protein
MAEQALAELDAALDRVGLARGAGPHPHSMTVYKTRNCTGNLGVTTDIALGRLIQTLKREARRAANS